MEQSFALKVLKSGQNVFLTGPAGTGKTHLLNQFTAHLREHAIHFAVTASTGIASTHLNGTTIHSWSGMGIKDEFTDKDYKKIRWNKPLLKRLRDTKTLIIDEISMLHSNQLNLLNNILKTIRDNPKAFGGIQIILCGDFFQLPPVDKQNMGDKRFAFMSLAWQEARFRICYLTKQYRQIDDPLSDVLMEIRNQNISPQSMDILQQKCTQTPDENATILYTHNVDVNGFNADKLAGINSPKRPFVGNFKGDKTLCLALEKSMVVQKALMLKIGANVMFLKNNAEKGYFNGTQGVVKSFNEKGFPVVKTQNGKTITVSPEVWSINDHTDRPLASFTQIPLKLSWAITIHKSQGMTLDTAYIDLSKTFERGQGYVALSRVRTLKNLYLKGFEIDSLAIGKMVRKADVRFRELSLENEVEFNEILLEALQKKWLDFHSPMKKTTFF